MEKSYQVLKFYCYTPIENPEIIQKNHYDFGKKNNLRGRIKVAKEGINGTLSGHHKEIQAYIAYLKGNSSFSTVTLNQVDYDHHVHQKLHVRVKPEIVHAGLPEITPSPHIKERCYITPEDFYKIRNQNDVQIIDVRSNYEHRLGTFEKALTFDIDNFREFPKKVDQLTLDKDKKYILACTSGIKCEKARDYLKKTKELPHVYHLQGGIIGYAQKTDGNGFEGVCYVFDERLTLEVNRKNPSIRSHCHQCSCLSYRMVNCANPDCNLHIPMCPSCSKKYEGACSFSCQSTQKKRPYDGTGFYSKKA